MAYRNNHFSAGLKHGFRSGLEDKNAKHLEALGIKVHYEEYKLQYEKPARIAKYNPDFPMIHNGIIIETKGRFVTADRQKHLLIKKQWPSLDIRFVFSNPNSKISKQSKTTYATWCESKGFQYAKALIPVEWIKEEPEPVRMAALKEALGLET